MGKEAKIGLSIIGVLVIVFAIVLGCKLFGSKDDPEIAKGKKTSASRKDRGKKTHPPKKNRFDSFKPKKHRGPKSSSDSKGTATSALPVNQNLPGNRNLTNNTTDYKKRYGRSAAADSPMPNTKGSIHMKAKAGTDASSYPSYATNHSGDYFKKPGHKPSPAKKDPFKNTAATNTTSTPYSSPGYQPYSPTDSTASNPYYSNTSSTPNTNSHTSQYGSNQTGSYDQKYSKHHPRHSRNTGLTQNGYTPSSSYPSGNATASSDYKYSNDYKYSDYRQKTPGYRSPDRRSTDYRSDDPKKKSPYYHSASHTKPKYEPKPYAYSGFDSYKAPSHSRSNYGGGPQADGTYIVKPHQTYCSISKEIYGIDAYFKALAEVNRSSIRDENRLRVGDRIKTPDVAELQQKYPDLCPSPKRLATMRRRSEITESNPPYGGSGRQYTVQSGDTLYDIARYELGDAARWTDIYKLNRSVLKDSFDYLTPGMKLELPDKNDKPATSETVYDPSSRYRDSSSKHKDYRRETPRTATRPDAYRSSPTYRPTYYD